MKYYIGIDLGDTNIAAGLVNESFEIVASTSCPTALPVPLPKWKRIWPSCAGSSSPVRA